MNQSGVLKARKMSRERAIRKQPRKNANELATLDVFTCSLFENSEIK